MLRVREEIRDVKKTLTRIESQIQRLSEALKATGKIQPKILYECDRRDPKCRACDSFCGLTTNIEHAENFRRVKIGNVTDYIEKAGEDHVKPF